MPATHAEKETAVFAAMGHVVLPDADLGEAVRTSLMEQGAAHVMSLVDRSVDRGELPERSRRRGTPRGRTDGRIRRHGNRR
ncbi:hypothetical protein ACFRMN_23020 [Streptomyces sp. NPDC056835]|uniref:hypothetical protein n=1 Tax=Streptomyces sp. NPDC056835 TaxID=3345956 RepID=UPI00368BA651